MYCAPLHRDAFCQFLFRWIYYCYSSKSTGKETGKTHLCALHCAEHADFLYIFFSKLLKSKTLRSYKYRTTWKLLIVTTMNIKNVLRYLHQKLIGKCWPSIHLMLFGAKICGCMQHIFLQNQLHTQLVCWLVYLRIVGK